MKASSRSPYTLENRKVRPPIRRLALLLVALAFLASAGQLRAQSLFASLTGVVSDASGAVVPGAKVTLVNEKSNSTRNTVTDSAGYYSFASISVGDFTYKLLVSASGFEQYQASGLQLLGGQTRKLNIEVRLGATSETVEVTGAVTSIVPVDSGEKSQTLTTKELSDYVQVGSDAAEFIKIMPGFSIQNGTQNRANYTGEVIGINANGDAGSQSPLNNAYSYYGLPGNSLDIVADGAHVSDPGCNCDTPVNPNGDMVSEFKVSTSYSAENQKGPVVISSVTKAGGSQFHGDAMFSARNFNLNANDSLFNKSGQSRPENKYYYPEGQIGGPVLIPGTNFNKARNKMFFFTGFEYYYQVLDTGLLRATVPTDGMRSGNFSADELAKLGSNTTAGGPAALNAAALAKFPGGIIPQMQAGQPGTGYDPSQMALMKLYPLPNADPNSNGGYNYVRAETFNQNNREWKSRVDFNISDNTKLFVRYSYQRELQQFPVGLWWRNNNQVPYPTPIQGKNRSDSVSASLTHVFSPTMTNEVVFGYTFIGFPNVFEDPKKVDRASVGYSYKGLFKNGVSQIPSYGSLWGGGDAALVFNPSGFEAGGPSSGLYANKWMPSVSDTLSKVVGTHTLKAGFYWEWIRNSQPASDYANGLQEFDTWNSHSMGDAYADLALGLLSSYQETSFDRINDISYNTYEGFLQDDWKATRRLTLNYGIRLTHFQPWIDRLGYGYTVFNPSLYKGADCTGAPSFCGFDWHKQNPNVPVGGFPTRTLFYQPRIGAAYDLFGKGKTVLRGSWGRYYFHAGQFTSGLEASAGVTSIGLGSTVNLNGQDVPLYAGLLDTLSAKGQASSPSAVDLKDDKQANTDFFNLTISQRAPWSSLLEISYVGNRTHDIPSSGNGGSAGFNTLNINRIPLGAMLAANNGGQDPNNLPCVGNFCNGDQFRPLQGYGDLFVATNNAYSNYNALQVTWVRTQGRYSVNMNYTYGKALGIVGFYDQFNLRDNYGVMPGNRTHVFNAAYYIDLPKPAHNRLAAQFVNGWQLSGITQIESGANLTGYSGQNFSMNLNNATIPGTDVQISNKSILGTTDFQLNPVLTCDPRSGLGAHQYVNPSCFAAPTVPGQNGPTMLPAIYGPSFFNWDLGLFKRFKISESKAFEFRMTGFNFLNHPLWSFAGGNNLNLVFDPATLTTKKADGTLMNPNFGTTTDKQGHRIVQLQVKFVF